MTGIISAIADDASIIYRGRAFMSAFADTPCMEENWRSRLEAAITQAGRSMRDVSLGARLNPGYVQSILTDGKDPGVERLLAVCDELGVSSTYILYGIDVSAEDAEIIGAMRGDPATRDAILSLLRRRLQSPA